MPQFCLRREVLTAGGTLSSGTSSCSGRRPSEEGSGCTKCVQSPCWQVQAAMRSKLKYESAAEVRCSAVGTP